MRSGFVAVAGRPNVGKSSLVNALAGGKVAIVSDKPQTTRFRISAVVNDPGYQLVLVDLPGFQRPLDPMTERMRRSVETGLEDVDGVLFVLTVAEAIGPGDRYVANTVFRTGAPVVIALNKVDIVEPSRIAEQITVAAGLGTFVELHPVSAFTGDGVRKLRDTINALLPDGPTYFQSDEITDLSVDTRVAELVREQALAVTHEEVPHALSVEVVEHDEARVEAKIYVETSSQKGIVIGKSGGRIRDIGSRARPEIEALLGREVFLHLQVKVRPKWRRDERMLERLGI